MTKHVVVIGAGIAGLRVAQAVRKKKDVSVTLVSDRDSFAFLPRLTELFSGELKEHEVLLKLREVFKGELILEKANLVNPVEKSVILNSGKTLTYDVLVIATGSVPNFFGTPGSQYSYPFYSPHDMQKLREQVDIMLSGDEQKGTHTFAVVGGGPTGVEVAHTLSRYAKEKRKGSKVLLLEGSNAILRMMPENLRNAATAELQKEEIEIVTDACVSDITPMSVTIKKTDGSKETIPCYTTIWAAGSKPSTIQITGIEYTPKGEVPVRPTLQSQADNSIFVVGDCAASGAPKTAQVAMQQADTVIDNVNNVLDGKPLHPFVYKDKGTVIALSNGTIGIFFGQLLRGFVAQQLRDKYYRLRFSQYK